MTERQPKAAAPDLIDDFVRVHRELTRPAAPDAAPSDGLDVERLASAMNNAFTVDDQERFVDDTAFWRDFAPRVAREYGTAREATNG